MVTTTRTRSTIPASADATPGTTLEHAIDETLRFVGAPRGVLSAELAIDLLEALAYVAERDPRPGATLALLGDAVKTYLERDLVGADELTERLAALRQLAGSAR